jgi:hypothetical protein
VLEEDAFAWAVFGGCDDLVFVSKLHEHRACRNGTFSPMVVPKGGRRLDGLDHTLLRASRGAPAGRSINAREAVESSSCGFLNVLRGSRPVCSPLERPARGHNSDVCCLLRFIGSAHASNSHFGPGA